HSTSPRFLRLLRRPLDHHAGVTCPRRSVMTLHAAIVLIAGLMVSQTPAAADPVKEEIAKFEGSWRVVSGMHGGEVGADARDYTMVFRADTFSLRRGDRFVMTGRFKSDPSKTPKVVDMVITDEDGEEEIHGIYAFGEGSLTWCIG